MLLGKPFSSSVMAFPSVNLFTVSVSQKCKENQSCRTAFEILLKEEDLEFRGFWCDCTVLCVDRMVGYTISQCTPQSTLEALRAIKAPHSFPSKEGAEQD